MATGCIRAAPNIISPPSSSSRSFVFTSSSNLRTYYGHDIIIIIHNQNHDGDGDYSMLTTSHIYSGRSNILIFLLVFGVFVWKKLRTCHIYVCAIAPCSRRKKSKASKNWIYNVNNKAHWRKHRLANRISRKKYLSIFASFDGAIWRRSKRTVYFFAAIESPPNVN